MNAAHRRFAWFAWAVLLFNIPVILWGAYVRVSYSGDGCGANWPFCNGQALPQHMTKPTAIEFTHRMMTSVDTVMVIALVAFAFWLYPKWHMIRRYAVASLVFLFIEALLGAGLVLFRMVAHDQSVGRVWYLSAHFTNTMLLLATIAITAWLASTGLSEIRFRQASPALLWSALTVFLVSLTGVVTALGDMLFPSNSLMQGVQRDLSSASPLLLRVRVAHPAIALAGALFIVWNAMTAAKNAPGRSEKVAALRVAGLCSLQLGVGAANLGLLAPVWMQLIHLLMADVVWISMVLLVLEEAATQRVIEPEFVSGLSREPTAGKTA